MSRADGVTKLPSGDDDTIWEGDEMQNGNWGHCKNCKHFGSPAARPLEAEEARCQAPKLAPFNLRIYGSNGCNQWELRPGLSDADAQRRSQQPDAPGMGIEEGTLQ